MAPSPSVSLISSGHHPLLFTTALLSYLSSCFSGKPAPLPRPPSGFPSLESSFLLNFPLKFSHFSLSPLGLNCDLKTCIALHCPELAHNVPALSSSCPSPPFLHQQVPSAVCTIHLLFTATTRCDSSITRPLHTAP